MSTYHFDYSDEHLAVPHDAITKDALPGEQLKKRRTSSRLRKCRLFSAQHYVISQAINKPFSFSFEMLLFALTISFYREDMSLAVRTKNFITFWLKRDKKKQQVFLTLYKIHYAKYIT